MCYRFQFLFLKYLFVYCLARKVIILIFFATVFSGCKKILNFSHNKEIIIKARVTAKWIQIDREGTGFEDEKLGKTATLVLLKNLKDLKEVKFIESNEGEMNLTITVIKESDERYMSAETIEGGVDDKNYREDKDEIRNQAITTENLSKNDDDSRGQNSEKVLYVLRYRGNENWPLSSALLVNPYDNKYSNNNSLLSGEVIRELTFSIIRQIKLLHSNINEVRSSLDTDDEDLLILAIRILGEKRDRESVLRLCNLLSASGINERVRGDIVAALEKIGDPRASPYLIRAYANAEPWEEIQIIKALQMTGGKEAKFFLQAVASGHDLAPTRKIAEDALRNIK